MFYSIGNCFCLQFIRFSPFCAISNTFPPFAVNDLGNAVFYTWWPENQNVKNALFTDRDKQLDLEVSLAACIGGCELFQCYFYKWYVYFCDQLEVWSMSPSWGSQALPQFPRNGEHLEKEMSKWKIQTLTPNTCRQDARGLLLQCQFGNKQNKHTNQIEYVCLIVLHLQSLVSNKELKK